MRLRIAGLAALLIAAPVVSHAADARLAWNDCDGAGGLHSIVFDCNTNSQTHTLVASFTAPPGISAYVSNQATILVQFYGASVPDWWAIKGGGQCRNGAATGDANFVSGPLGCTDVWAGQASGGLASYNVANGPSQTRMNLVFAVPSSKAQPLVAGQEYYAFKVTILNDKTVGAGSCSGCAIPAGIVLSDLRVIQTTGTGDVRLGDQFDEITDRSVVGWQCPTTLQRSCDSMSQTCDNILRPDCSTPAQNHTWGAIKSIYR